MAEDENFLDKCRTCKHCYTKKDDDYVYCRKRNGKCEYKPYKSRNAEVSKNDRADGTIKH